MRWQRVPGDSSSAIGGNVSFSQLEDYGIYGHGPARCEKCAKTAHNRRRLEPAFEEDRRDVEWLRLGVGDIMPIRGGLRVSETALTYVQRHV